MKLLRFPIQKRRDPLGQRLKSGLNLNRRRDSESCWIVYSTEGHSRKTPQDIWKKHKSRNILPSPQTLLRHSILYHSNTQTRPLARVTVRGPKSIIGTSPRVVMMSGEWGMTNARRGSISTKRKSQRKSRTTR